MPDSIKRVLQTQLSAAEDDPELLQPIGVVASRWAALDTYLLNLLGILLGSDRAADIVYFSLANFKARLDIIANLTKELVVDDKAKEALLTCLNRVDRLGDTRNKVIHSAIYMGTLDASQGASHLRWDRKPGKPRAFVPVKKGDLIQHAEAVLEVAFKILLLAKPAEADAMIAASWDSLASSPDMQPLPPRDKFLQQVKKRRVLKIKRARPHPTFRL